MLIHQTHNSRSNYAYNCFFYRNIRWDFHFHRNFEFIYVESGQVGCTINGKSGILEAGDFAMCLSNEIHEYHSIGDSTSWVAVFSGDFIHAFEKLCQNKVGTDFRFSCPPEILDFLKASLFGAVNPPLFTLKACFYAVCAAYTNAITLTEQSGKSDLLMRNIAEFVSKNYKNDINLSDLAQELGYDYFYISKAFRRIFNMSFSDFLNSYRLENALRLLTESDKTVTDIAYESGFQSIRSFNHFFKAKTGKTPAQYRSAQ